MAEKGVLRNDPWRELTRSKGNQQVELGEVMRVLAVQGRDSSAMKKALLSKVSRLTRGQ